MKSELPGCIYFNKNRYWWKVQLPGEAVPKSRPLRPAGSKWATKDKAVAEEVARLMWEEAVFSPGTMQGRPRTIADLVARYLNWAAGYYSTSREQENISYGLRPLVELYGDTTHEEFGPLKLKRVRQEMIDRGWSRGVINQRVGMIRRMFHWAVGEQYVHAMVYAALQAVEGLRRGRTDAKETEAIKPVEERHIFAILPFTSKVVADMIVVQLYTGMRPGELCQMRPCDIETGGAVWFYRPREHKTAYRGFVRAIAIGPKAQKVLKPYLKRRLNDYCFKPGESQKQRGIRNHKKIKDCYDRGTYRRALTYAIRAARKAGVDVPHFHPNQLRHTAGTRIRKEQGLEVAKAALGHRKVETTQIYAEVNEGLAAKAAMASG